ncbi:hypothetical protein MEZE111188_20875 [Mesobacillus zeae]
MRFDLFQLLNTDQPIRKCKCCGRYFIPHNRIDAEYYQFIGYCVTKPCSVIGPLRNYQNARKDNPIHTEFCKAYKRNNSRARYGSISHQEFYEWSEAQCLSGEISLEEFREWLGNKK